VFYEKDYEKSDFTQFCLDGFVIGYDDHGPIYEKDFANLSPELKRFYDLKGFEY